MQVLPGGHFEFKYNEQTVRGKFCTWAMKRFCDRMKIPNLAGMFQVFTDGISIEAVAVFLSAAVEYTYIKEGKDYPFSDIDSYDWIDEQGGVGEVVKMIVECVSTKEAEQETTEVQKKRKVKPR